jgi:hypothetical protein
MSLLKELGISPAEVNITEIETQMAGNGLPPEGIHHAVLSSVGGIPNADGRGWKFLFEILAGPGKGMTVEEALWKPKGDDAKKDARVKNRVLIFAHRLGLLKKVAGADGKETSQEIDGKHDFCDCLGATCFIKLQHEEEEYERDGKKRKITKAKLAFNGCMGPEDKEVRDGIAAGKIAVASGTAVAAAASAKPAAAQKKETFDDL